MNKYKYAVFLVFLCCAFSCSQTQTQYGVQNVGANAIIESAEDAFRQAESEIFLVNPIPDDKPLGPDPDPEKCACRGTGKIVHGDGHVTSCPFHPIELIMNKYQTGD
jgi:hypothetical protein